jgi:hypothetical protein
LPPPDGVSADADQQRRNVKQFFAQFTAPSGALRGGVMTYDSVEEFSGRFRTDIESLLPSLPREEHELSSDSSWYQRAEARVHRWHYARLLLVLVLGTVVTIVAWTAFASFSEALRENEPPLLAYVIRYIFVALGVLVPVLLVLTIWWWLGREGANRED